jgi:hypothetical protein
LCCACDPYCLRHRIANSPLVVVQVQGSEPVCRLMTSVVPRRSIARLQQRQGSEFQTDIGCFSVWLWPRLAAESSPVHAAPSHGGPAGCHRSSSVSGTSTQLYDLIRRIQICISHINLGKQNRSARALPPSPCAASDVKNWPRLLRSLCDASWGRVGGARTGERARQMRSRDPAMFSSAAAPSSYLWLAVAGKEDQQN